MRVSIYSHLFQMFCSHFLSMSHLDLHLVHVLCYHNNSKDAFFNSRDSPNLSHEVIRSQYVHSIQPDMTRVTVKVYHPSKVSSSYRSSTVTITGEWLTINSLLIIVTIYYHYYSSQLQAPPLMLLPAGLVTPLYWSPGLPHHHHQLAMRCSIRH